MNAMQHDQGQLKTSAQHHLQFNYTISKEEAVMKETADTH